MRKIILLAFLVLVPISVYADLKAIDDSGLNEITAQEGVRITIGGEGITTTTYTSLWTNSAGYYLNAEGKLLGSDGSVVTDVSDAVLRENPEPPGTDGVNVAGYYIDNNGELLAEDGTTTTDVNLAVLQYNPVPANTSRTPVLSGALKIKQKAVSTAWTNKNAAGDTETGIVNKVTQTNCDVIYIAGELTIEAKTDGAVSSVDIGLPEVVIEKGSKKTEIYITNRTSNLDDSNFISQVTGPGAPGKLGTQYTDAGFTHIVPGGNVSITSMP